MRNVPLFIDGAWREGARGRSGRVLDPATEEPVARVAHAEAEDVSAAVTAAEAGFLRWRDTAPAARARLLRDAARRLSERIEDATAALTAEQGKTLGEARAELDRAVDTLLWHSEAAAQAEEPRGSGRGGDGVRAEPIGVVAAFAPWNYPAVIVARKLGAALAAGCSVVLKAAEETPSAAACVVAALEDAGLPAGVVNLVFGDPPSISAQLLAIDAVRAFTFTGSTAVGRQLAELAARGLKRCVLELGGHAPVLVCRDADIDAAVAAIVAYKFECAGQSCNAPSRLYVEQPLYPRFVEHLVAAARALRVGNGAHAGVDMGPLANPRRLAAMERLLLDACERGAAVATGGERLRRAGYFWPPTVLTGVPDDAAVMTEEPFGPLLPVAPVASLEEGLARANASAYGLAGYVFTRSAELAERAARALAVGSVGINQLRGVPPDVGIAGVKDSGYGYEGGWLGIEAFQNLKVVRGGL